MNFIDAKTTESIVLNLIVKNRAGSLEDQTSPYPTINIFRMNGTSSTEVLAATLMSEDVAGEYQYEWDVDNTPAIYKAKYIMLIDGVVHSGYDLIRVTSPEDKYRGYGK